MSKEQRPRIPVTPGSTYDAQIKWAPDAHDEIERLRGLLARLEWACHYDCPACGGREIHGGHDPDCWLAAELGTLPEEPR
jgi:hypothetical protein